MLGLIIIFFKDKIKCTDHEDDSYETLHAEWSDVTRKPTEMVNNHTRNQLADNNCRGGGCDADFWGRKSQHKDKNETKYGTNPLPGRRFRDFEYVSVAKNNNDNA